jgi:tRNA(adenine34) deaminase
VARPRSSAGRGPAKHNHALRRTLGVPPRWDNSRVHCQSQWLSHALGWPVNDEFFMQMALDLAQAAAAADEAPVGAVIVREGQVLAAARNEREALRDPTAHAEMIAITQAAAALESWRLEDCTLYVTLEPCCMCAGAIVQARVPRVVYGAIDLKAGAVRSLFRLLDDPRLNHRCELVEGVLAEPCGRVLTEFFQGKRERRTR